MVFLKRGVIFSLISLLLVLLLVSFSALLTDKSFFVSESLIEKVEFTSLVSLEKNVAREVAALFDISVPVFTSSTIYFEHLGRFSQNSFERDDEITDQYSILSTYLQQDLNKTFPFTVLLPSLGDLVFNKGDGLHNLEITYQETKMEIDLATFKGISLRIQLPDGYSITESTLPSSTFDDNDYFFEIDIFSSSVLLDSSSLYITPNSDYLFDFSTGSLAVSFDSSGIITLSPSGVSLEIRDVTLEFDTITSPFLFLKEDAVINGVPRQLFLR